MFLYTIIGIKEKDRLIKKLKDKLLEASETGWKEHMHKSNIHAIHAINNIHTL